MAEAGVVNERRRAARLSRLPIDVPGDERERGRNRSAEFLRSVEERSVIKYIKARFTALYKQEEITFHDSRRADAQSRHSQPPPLKNTILSHTLQASHQSRPFQLQAVKVRDHNGRSEKMLCIKEPGQGFGYQPSTMKQRRLHSQSVEVKRRYKLSLFVKAVTGIASAKVCPTGIVLAKIR